MSKPLELLSARNIILAAAGILLLSVIGVLVSMLGERDSGGLARNSYGTRREGHRAVFELLERFRVPVARELTPPGDETERSGTLALLDPDPGLVEVNSKYLRSLLDWVDAGGRLVVSVREKASPIPNTISMQGEAKARDVLQALELEPLIKLGQFGEGYTKIDFTGEGAGNKWKSDDEFSPEEFWKLTEELEPPQILPVTFGGSLTPLAGEVREVALPAEGFTAIRADRKKLSGWMAFKGADGKSHLLVAVVPHGSGEIVVVSDRSLFNNRLLAQADNSVLAVHLLAPSGGPVVFDEFYHGLAVRGNALYLLTRPGFAAATAAILLLVGALAWRAAVFLGPPLAAKQATRRDIREYIHAMGRFLSRGRGSRWFLAREVRDGVLHELCSELKLPLESLDTEKITAALARRDKQRAARLESALRAVDAELASAREYPRSKFIPDMQGLANCL